MKKLVVGVVGIFFAASSFGGIIPGNDITVSDKWSKGTGWYGPQEDQEVEWGYNGNIATQKWDLEGFFFDQNNMNLAMTGGYNFKSGQDGFLSGDIFIDVTKDAKYGVPDITPGAYAQYKTVLNDKGWDYAIDLNFTNNSYKVYKIDAGDKVKTPYWGSNVPSTPFEYVSGGTLVTTGSFSYLTGKTDLQTGFTGGLHNIVQGIDLSFLKTDANFKKNQEITTHFTMGCGNDNLIGNWKKSTNVPEPGTLSLIGIGLLSLAGLLRFRRKK